MKALILSLTVLFPSLVFACNNKIDPNKVMLFVDTNNSELEIATTQKAACARGERLVVVPKNYQEYGQYTKAIDTAQKKANSACNNGSGPGCTIAMEELNKAYQSLDEFKMKQPQTSEGVKQALEEIKQAGAKLQNFNISGHDGGGSFGGNKGSFSREDLAEIMKDYGDINEVKSLLLLGCYTGTQFEVMQWKSIFPDARVIAGYDGSAPLAHRPQGHQYISDILTKEKNLVQQADQQRLQSFVDANIKGLSNLNAAMYLQCGEEESGNEYYYGSQSSRRIRTFDTKECLDKKDQLQQVTVTLEKYSSGELEPPLDTQGGELRALYNFARENEHCIELTGIHIDTNAIFNLLFYKGVEESFGNFYKDDLKEMEKYLALNEEEMEKNLNEHLALTEEEAKKLDTLAELLETAPEAYFAQREAELAKVKAAFDKMFNDPAYSSVKNLIDLETGAIDYGQNITDEQYDKLSKLSFAFSNYLAQKQGIEAEKADPKRTAEVLRSNADFTRQIIQNSRVSFETLKQDLKNPEKKIWIPTAENLKNHSRKELMSNIHRINGLMSLPVLNQDQRKAISWMSSTTSMHLQFFQNPFSWHEFTGRVEAPEYTRTLQQAMSEPDNQYGGYGGGFGYGGGYGGGIAGGMGGGFGSSSTGMGW